MHMTPFEDRPWGRHSGLSDGQECVHEDRRAWTAATIDERAAWYYPVPAECLAAVRQLANDGRPVTETVLPETMRAVCVRALQPVRDALEAGRGFAVVEGPRERLAPADAQRLYWIVGQALGRPCAQNVQGTLLYDVRDTGQELTQGARFSVTNYESSFHTDNSFGEEVVDYVGLLCLQTAKMGGRSQVISGFSLCNDLLTRQPDVLSTLREPFHVERRGGVRAGQSPTIQFPVLVRSDGEVLFRYLRYWIETGHVLAGQPLTATQKATLDALDDAARQTSLRVEFDLQPGQMFFINNRWILHNRTAFEDHNDPELRRHLVRLWLQATS